MKYLISLAALAIATSVAMAAQPSVEDQIAVSRKAAAKYWDISAAKADGYEPLFECSENEAGNMGQHLLNPARAGDGKLVLEEPEALMYEPQPDGTMQLVAMEYLVFEKDWTGATPPTFMGQKMQRKTAVGPHAVDPFYELHVWHWRHNPAGMFSDWNTDVSCH